MTTPLFLHTLTGSRYLVPRDYVAELADATQHLGLDIDPNGQWGDAMARILMISTISYLCELSARGIVPRYIFEAPRITRLAHVETKMQNNDMSAVCVALVSPYRHKKPSVSGSVNVTSTK